MTTPQIVNDQAKTSDYFNELNKYGRLGIVTSMFEMPKTTHLESQEEANARVKRQTYIDSLTVKKYDFNGGKYTYFSCSETGFKIVRCKQEQYGFVNGKDNYWDIVRPGEMGYWEYACKKGLVEGYGPDGIPIV
jgi:hypothetical protein